MSLFFFKQLAYRCGFVILSLGIFFYTHTEAKAFEKLIIIGSSTAAGVGASSPDVSWGGLLKKWAKDNRDLQIENLAAAGTLTKDAICTDEKSVTQRAFALGAKFLIVSYPSNDATADIPPEQSVENIRSILRCASNRGIKVAVMSTLPRSGLSQNQRKAIAQFDSILSREIGSCFIDVQLALADTTGLNPRTNLSAGDGVHFNNNGHYVIYTIVKNFINEGKCF
jgi:lysophospholipase L1-like esterase